MIAVTSTFPETGSKQQETEHRCPNVDSVDKIEVQLRRCSVSHVRIVDKTCRRSHSSDLVGHRESRAPKLVHNRCLTSPQFSACGVDQSRAALGYNAPVCSYSLLRPFHFAAVTTSVHHSKEPIWSDVSACNILQSCAVTEQQRRKMVLVAPRTHRDGTEIAGHLSVF